MVKIFNKNTNITSPTSTSGAAPARDFLILLVVLITTPFIFIFSILTGRIRSPFIIVAFLVSLLTGLYYLSKSDVISKKDIKNRIIQETMEEITPEEKEEMRNEISTLRESFDEEKLPKLFAPLLDVPMDMLSINYFIFMLQSGYIQPDGSGSEALLDSYLHSSHTMLSEKAWEILNNIKTPASDRILNNFEIELKRKEEQHKRDSLKNTSTLDGLENKLNSGLQDIKNKYNLNPK
jgi:hypothetical protein